MDITLALCEFSGTTTVIKESLHITNNGCEIAELISLKKLGYILYHLVQVLYSLVFNLNISGPYKFWAIVVHLGLCQYYPHYGLKLPHLPLHTQRYLIHFPSQSPTLCKAPRCADLTISILPIFHFLPVVFILLPRRWGLMFLINKLALIYLPLLIGQIFYYIQEWPQDYFF